MVHRAALITVSCSPQPDTSRSCKTTDTGLVHRVVCPLTPQFSLVVINPLPFGSKPQASFYNYIIYHIVADGRTDRIVPITAPSRANCTKLTAYEFFESPDLIQQSQNI